MHWLYDLPTWLLCTVIISTAVLCSMAGVYVVRRRGLMLSTEDTATAGFAHAFVGVVYAVALGLMVVGVQSDYEEVETVAVKEASLASDMYRDLEGFPDPERTEIQALTRRYIDAVIDKEWPAVSHGGTSEETWALADSMARRIITYQPATAHGQLVYPEILSHVNEMLDDRRARLFLGKSGVGTITWVIVLIGAFIIFVVAWFFNTPSARAHYALVAAMSAMFGLMIFLIVAMDHPLWGSFSVQADAFRAVKENIVRWDRERPPATLKQ